MKNSLPSWIAIVLACVVYASGAWAQTAQPSPTPEQMIEQLKRPATRSLRNLTVESATPGAPSPTAATTPASTPTAANSQASAPSSAVVAALPSAAAPRPSLSLLIQFDFNSARVRPESQQALSNLAVALKSPDLMDSRFSVEGHTDAKGRADYNLKLSQERADAVRDYLVAQGIARTRLASEGKGAGDLANQGDPFAAENRRVRIVNLD
jgi:outer membrane protein OmpA-like peptidoglycan-associated protein